MGPWITYLKERFPLPVYVLLVGGMAGSGTRLAGGPLFGGAFWASFGGLMLFFGVLRLMDELKDYSKDCIAHPERPLPRGLLNLETVRKVILALVVVMFLFGLSLYPFSRGAAGLYVLVTLYLWLMYQEFYVGAWLGRRPLLYAITHQVILLPLCAFPVALARGNWKCVGMLYGTLVLGAFFSYEVSRKLDPKANPILGYYRQLFGVGGCLAIVGVCALVSAWAASVLELAFLTAPFAGLLILSFGLLSRGGHKAVEAIASMSLLVHIWSILLKGWL